MKQKYELKVSFPVSLYSTVKYYQMLVGGLRLLRSLLEKSWSLLVTNTVTGPMVTSPFSLGITLVPCRRDTTEHQISPASASPAFGDSPQGPRSPRRVWPSSWFYQAPCKGESALGRDTQSSMSDYCKLSFSGVWLINRPVNCVYKQYQLLS